MSACTFEPRAGEPRTTRRVDIEFLYIDLTTCSRCLGTDENLEAALGMVAQVLEATGVEVQVRKILVESEQQAEALHFVSSPTIRVNGRDIALQTKESSCGSCSELAGQDTGCRVWAYQGRDPPPRRWG